MKKLLTSLLLTLLSLETQAGDTNVTIKVTVEIPGNGTNSTSLTLGYNTPKDKSRIDGLSWMYNTARAGGFTNTFDNWYAKVFEKDNSQSAADAYNRVNSVATLQKLTDLLTINIDLLSASDLTSLNTIAAKNPVP